MANEVCDVGHRSRNSGHLVEFTSEVYNDGDLAASSVQVIVTTYAADGTVAASQSTSVAGWLLPGETAPYEIGLDSTGAERVKTEMTWTERPEFTGYRAARTTEAQARDIAVGVGFARTHVTGQVVSDAPVTSTVKLEVWFVNAAGEVVAQADAYIDTVAPGASRPFDIAFWSTVPAGSQLRVRAQVAF